MSPKFLLRLLLAALICLNGTTALWASTRMAIDHEVAHPGTGDAHADHDEARTSPACIGDGCPSPVPAPEAGDSHTHDTGEACACNGGGVTGCTCNCVFPASFIAVSVPSIARHPLRTPPPAYAEIHAPRRWAGSIFRPPIG